MLTIFKGAGYGAYNELKSDYLERQSGTIIIFADPDLKIGEMVKVNTPVQEHWAKRVIEKVKNLEIK